MVIYLPNLADSSTDTDPEEPANRRLSQDLGNKKGKAKKRTKSLKSKDDKLKITKKDKKDIKKEKENKDLSKRLRVNRILFSHCQIYAIVLLISLRSTKLHHNIMLHYNYI